MAEYERELPVEPFAELGLEPGCRDGLSRRPLRRRRSSVLVYGVGWGVRSPRGWRGVFVRTGRWLLRLGGESW
jgi:hypothetical protein